MARTNLLKDLGLGTLDLKSRWCISSNKKRLLDLVAEKKKNKEGFSLKERKKFLAFMISCKICKETGNWLQSKERAKDIVNNLDVYTLFAESKKAINVFKRMFKRDKNGLSKSRKSSKESDKQ